MGYFHANRDWLFESLLVVQLIRFLMGIFPGLFFISDFFLAGWLLCRSECQALPPHKDRGNQGWQVSCFAMIPPVSGSLREFGQDTHCPV